MTMRRERAERARARARQKRRTRRSALSVALAGGLLLAGGVSVSAAALADHAIVTLGGAEPGSGVGFDGTFGIALVDPSGVVREAPSSGPLVQTIAGASALVPGGTVTTDIPVFNNTARLGAAVSVTLVAQASAGTPDITDWLRFTATDDDGTVLFADATLADAQGALAVLAPRGADPLADGTTYTAGAAGSAQTLHLQIHYLDAPETAALNGGTAALAVRFAAASVSS